MSRARTMQYPQSCSRPCAKGPSVNTTLRSSRRSDVAEPDGASGAAPANCPDARSRSMYGLQVDQEHVAHRSSPALAREELAQLRGVELRRVGADFSVLDAKERGNLQRAHRSR